MLTVQVWGGQDEHSIRTIFHTAQYRTMLMPRVYADLDGRYRGLDGEVHSADFAYLSDLSLWDTYRTLHPWWVLAHPERAVDLARSLEGLPIATVKRAPLEPLEGYTFEGYRNDDGSVGTRNLLGITTTVQCVAGVVEFAVQRIRNELLPRYKNVDDVVGLEHSYGCGVAIDAAEAIIPIRTVRNISLNPNFGGEVMVVSLGCEKLQPDRTLPAGRRRGDLGHPVGPVMRTLSA